MSPYGEKERMKELKTGRVTRSSHSCQLSDDKIFRNYTGEKSSFYNGKAFQILPYSSDPSEWYQEWDK